MLSVLITLILITCIRKNINFFYFNSRESNCSTCFHKIVYCRKEMKTLLKNGRWIRVAESQVAFIARSLSYCARQTRRNTFLITITRSRCAISRISRTPRDRARCAPRDWASVRSILGAMIRKRATCSTSSTVFQRFRRISRGTNGSFNPLLLRASPALLTSYRVNSRGAWNLFWQASSSRACARANVRRSKMNGWYVSMVRS